MPFGAPFISAYDSCMTVPLNLSWMAANKETAAKNALSSLHWETEQSWKQDTVSTHPCYLFSFVVKPVYLQVWMQPKA